MDGGAWWAAIYGDTQSRTRLKRLRAAASCFGNATMLIHVDLARLFDLVVALFKKKSVFVFIFLLKLVYVKCGPCYKFLCIFSSILYLASLLFSIR